MYSLIDEAWNNISLDTLSDKLYETFEPLPTKNYVNELDDIYSDINTEDVLPEIKKSELSCDDLINKRQSKVKTLVQKGKLRRRQQVHLLNHISVADCFRFESSYHQDLH